MDNIAKVTYEHYRIFIHTLVSKWTMRHKGQPHPTILDRIYRSRPCKFVLPRGGMTRCIITLADGREVTGEALCSMGDNFNYKIGRRIAYGRAVKAVQERIKTEDVCVTRDDDDSLIAPPPWEITANP